MHSYVCCKLTHSCVNWLIHMRDTIYPHVWGDAFMCVKLCIHMCEVTCSCVCVVTHSCAAPGIHLRDTIYSFVWHSASAYVIWPTSTRCNTRVHDLQRTAPHWFMCVALQQTAIHVSMRMTQRVHICDVAHCNTLQHTYSCTATHCTTRIHVCGIATHCNTRIHACDTACPHMWHVWNTHDSFIYVTWRVMSHYEWIHMYSLTCLTHDEGGCESRHVHWYV